MLVADSHKESRHHKKVMDFRKLNKYKGKGNTNETKTLSLF
jgi:hypothetical protein